jgi:hypothetical protein
MLHGLPKYMPEMLLVLGIGSVTDADTRIESAIARDDSSGRRDPNTVSWWNLANFPVRGYVCFRLMSKVSSDVFVVNVQLGGRRQNQGINIS